ncbi:MAG: hypothetical protein H6732_01910 [Alphaproteobacteria bacterium]|nr:hypothetical protein [Alphaproteobacteria bacterium]
MRRPIPCSLCLAVLGCAAPAQPDAAGTDGGDDTDLPVPATAHWMADVFADHPEVPLGRVLLPGAFNSSSYACEARLGISPHAPAVVRTLWGDETTPDDDPNRQRVVDWARTQDRSLGRQLEDGIRFLEINVTIKDGVITTWHSVYGLPLDEVLDELVAFAQAWPDEIVVLTFGLDLEEEDLPQLVDLMAAPRDGTSVCSLLHDGEAPAATVALGALQAAGRPLVWAPGGRLRELLLAREGCTPSTVTLDRTWSITTTPEGVDAALAGSVDSRDPDHLLVNDFAFSLDGSASVVEQASFIGTYAGVREASLALGFAGDLPSRLIAAHDGMANLNVLAGAFYEDTDLVEAAIARNRARWAGE